MEQYSIKAQARKPVAIPDPLVMLDAGFNVFNVVTDDLETLLSDLENEGVTIIEASKMEQEPSSLEDMLVEGESPAMLGIPNFEK